jgi:hypothetical protein
MQRKYLLPSLLVLAVASVPALAEEIVYFTNGSSMPVQSHSIEDGTIRLDLGNQAYVAFPVAQIDRIETAEGEVRDSGSSPANQMVRGVSTGSVPARHRRQWQGSNAGNQTSRGQGVETHNGIAVYRPFANSPAPNKRRITTVAGGTRTPTSRPTANGVIGTTQTGSRFTLPTPGAQHKQPVALAPALDKPRSRNQNDNRDRAPDKNDEKQ